MEERSEEKSTDSFGFRALRYFLATRKGFGESSTAVEVVIRSSLRSFQLMVMPGLMTLFMVALLLGHEGLSDESTGDGIGGMIVRIFVFDYIFFFFALVSGFSMARQFRKSADVIEELSLTPLPPNLVGWVVTSGSLAIWGVALFVFGVFDMLTPIIQAKFVNEYGLKFFEFAFAIIATTIGPLLMAWFHFESIRLGHWMFAVHALPRISLSKAYVQNFLLMTVFVIGLSGIGSILTGVAGGVFFGIAMATKDFSSGGMAYSAWYAGSVPGLMLVLFLKRRICRIYEGQFTRAFLMYQWWGAGESTQPKRYPMGMQALARMWEAYHHMKEAEIAGRELGRIKWLRRYNWMRHQAGMDRSPIDRFHNPSSQDKSESGNYLM